MHLMLNKIFLLEKVSHPLSKIQQSCRCSLNLIQEICEHKNIVMNDREGTVQTL